jgi:soluble lytic murein transglycosylase-like protein
LHEAVLRNGFSITFDRQEATGDVTRLWIGEGYADVPTAQIDHVEDVQVPIAPAPAAQSPSTPANTLEDIVKTTAAKHHLDPDFVASVIRAESGGKVKAVSPKGARGLMQLMPDTASQLGVKDVFDPRANVEGGTRYLRELLDQYHGDAQKALAAYNAGPHRVQQYGGVPPYRETRAYVRSIITDFNRKKLSGAATQKTRPARKTSSASNSQPITNGPATRNTAGR